MIYTPAFDLYHSIYRMLHILSHFCSKDEVEVDRLRMWDFYVLFPFKTYDIKVMNKETEIREYRGKFISNKRNPYNEVFDDRRLFERMRPYQTLALNMIASFGIISPDQLRRHTVRIVNDNRIHALVAQLGPLTTTQSNTLSWLSLYFRTMPVGGVYGLKHRTNLLESKYDGC